MYFCSKDTDAWNFALPVQDLVDLGGGDDLDLLAGGITPYSYTPKRKRSESIEWFEEISTVKSSSDNNFLGTSGALASPLIVATPKGPKLGHIPELATPNFMFSPKKRGGERVFSSHFEDALPSASKAPAAAAGQDNKASVDKDISQDAVADAKLYLQTDTMKDLIEERLHPKPVVSEKVVLETKMKTKCPNSEVLECKENQTHQESSIEPKTTSQNANANATAHAAGMVSKIARPKFGGTASATSKKATTTAKASSSKGKLTLLRLPSKSRSAFRQ